MADNPPEGKVHWLLPSGENEDGPLASTLCPTSRIVEEGVWIVADDSRDVECKRCRRLLQLASGLSND